MDFTSPLAATVLLKRYMASHWIVLLQYIVGLQKTREYYLHRAARFANLSAASLEQCWSGVQYLNDRTANYCEQLEYALHQFAICGAEGNFPQQPNNNLAEDDFIHISSQFHSLKMRIETVISSMTGIISIIETKRMKRLSDLGMLFIPLAVTSGIFSMSGNYAPGGPSFWVYWIVAIPLVLLVFIVAFGLDSGPALMNSWLLKMRTWEPVQKGAPTFSTHSV